MEAVSQPKSQAGESQEYALGHLTSARRVDPSMDVDFGEGLFYLGAVYDLPHVLPPKKGETITWRPLIAVSNGEVFTTDAALAEASYPFMLEKPSLPMRLDGLFGAEERFSLDGLIAYVSKHRPPVDLADRLVRKLSQYVALPEVWQYDFLVAWAVGTYLFKVFPTYPILVLTSDQPGSGKSTLLSVLERLCFNAQRFNGFTESALIRTANDASCTIMLDEAEVLGRPQVTEGKLIELLNSRYEADALYRMAVEKRGGWEIQSFRLFGPTLLAKLKAGGIPPTIKSRAIEIVMRPLNTNNQHLQFDHPRYDQDWQGLRDGLYMWALYNWKQVYEAYRFDRDIRIGINRDMDVWRVVLSIAKVLSPEMFETLRGVAQRHPKASEEHGILREYVEDCKASGVEKAKVADIARELDGLPPSLRNSSKALCNALRTLGVRVKPGAGGYRYAYFLE